MGTYNLVLINSYLTKHCSRNIFTGQLNFSSSDRGIDIWFWNDVQIVSVMQSRNEKVGLNVAPITWPRCWELLVAAVGLGFML